MNSKNPTISEALNKWTGPLAALSVLIGGVVWLTTLHSISEQNSKDITELRVSLDQTKTKIYARLNDLDTRLGRIEGKIDMLIDAKR
tara:strand:+ start:8657 stop:8917 length:261 start_codon:yes stop_codon:yes gene_type:complete